MKKSAVLVCQALAKVVSLVPPHWKPYDSEAQILLHSVYSANITCKNYIKPKSGTLIKVHSLFTVKVLL